MSTAVRIKRKAGEMAADSIVLTPKIARIDDEDQAVGGSAALYTFHYAGSYRNPDSPEAGEAIRRAKEAARFKQDPKLRPVDLQSKLRDEHRSASKEKRLQTVQQHRAIIEELCTEEVIDNDESDLRETTNSMFRLYDVFAEANGTDPDTKENVDRKEEEKASKITCNDVAMVRETEKEPEEDLDYIFDVYYNAKHFNLQSGDKYSLFKVGSKDPFASETACDSDWDLGLEVHDDDSDSNAEENWRNDYPDEDVENRGSFYGDYCVEEGMDFVSGQLSGLTLNFDEDREEAYS